MYTYLYTYDKSLVNIYTTNSYTDQTLVIFTISHCVVVWDHHPAQATVIIKCKF